MLLARATPSERSDMKKIEELLGELIMRSRINSDMSLKKVDEIEAEIICRFAKLEAENQKLKESWQYKAVMELEKRAESAEAKLKEKELTSICVYCGTKLISKSIDTKMNDVIEHMAECKKHPVTSMLDKLLEIEKWFLQHREHSLEIWNGYATLHNNGMFTLSQSDNKTMKENKMLLLTKEQREEFEKLSKPLIKFLNDNLDTHCKIIIECDSTEIVSGLCAIQTDEFIKD